MQLHQQFPHARWVWVDVEDPADVVAPIEVENFPTLLIADPHRPGFLVPCPLTLKPCSAWYKPMRASSVHLGL